MEGLFFVLIGAALFSQSWYMLGVYSEGKTVGVLVGGLGVLAIAAVLLAPAATLTASGSAWMLLTGDGVKAGPWLAQTMIMKTLILAWGLYAVGVGAHGLWDLEEKAIGFYSAFLAVLSAVSFIYFAAELELLYGDQRNARIGGRDALPDRLGRNDVLHPFVHFQRVEGGDGLVHTHRRGRRGPRRPPHPVHRHSDNLGKPVNWKYGAPSFRGPEVPFGEVCLAT